MARDNPSVNNSDQAQILVTGSAGLVGNELIKQLLFAGEKVRAVYHHTPVTLSHPSLETVSCDILDVISLEKVMQGIKQVYHCAALVSYNPKDRQRLLTINIEGTANVVNACLTEGIDKLIHVSSVAALGRIRPGEMVTEKMNWTEESSNSIYGKSKYYGEMEVWRGVAEGLKAAIVNPSLILGGDNWETGSSAIFKNAFNEFKWYTEGVSGCVDVRDVARVMILLMQSDISGERFILSGENVPFRELFTSIAKCFGKKPPYKKVTPFLGELIWRLEALKGKLTGGNLLLTRETVHTAQTKVYFDNSKILKALPEFHFKAINKTIEFTCNQLKEKYHL